VATELAFEGYCFSLADFLFVTIPLTVISVSARLEHALITAVYTWRVVSCSSFSLPFYLAKYMSLASFHARQLTLPSVRLLDAFVFAFRGLPFWCQPSFGCSHSARKVSYKSNVSQPSHPWPHYHLGFARVGFGPCAAPKHMLSAFLRLTFLPVDACSTTPVSRPASLNSPGIIPVICSNFFYLISVSSLEKY